MKMLQYICLGISILFFTGCGQTVIETLHVPEDPGYNAPGTGKSVVILPFADYSEGSTFTSAHRRNLMVTETLTDRLSANGFSLPVQEDVFNYLVAEKVVGLAPYTSKSSSNLSYELEGDWSKEMKMEIQRYIDMQGLENFNNSPVASAGAHALTRQTVSKIGRHFNADYIVRGRILEFKTREEVTWEPWKKGILPFINNGANRILFGFADSDSYDQFNHQITGGILGGIIGNNNDSPWDTDDDVEVLGMNGDTANTVLWGAAGMAVGKQMYHSGRVDQAAVQMRIWIQEAATGEVVWTNRISVKVSPESFMADSQYDTLFNKAIEKSVTTLIDNFIIYTFL